LAACAAFAACAAACLAQPPGARPVEEGIGDVGPLSTGSRVLPRDLLRPHGFERVYELTRTDQVGRTEQTLIRMDGAVTAVFPRSVYRAIRPGVLAAEFPPGTIFHIGRLPPELDPPAPVHAPHALSASLAIDLSARGDADHSAPLAATAGGRSDAAPPVPGLAEPPSIWTHEEFRRDRLAGLLRRARHDRDAPREP